MREGEGNHGEAVAANAQYPIVVDRDDGPANVELTDYHR